MISGFRRDVDDICALLGYYVFLTYWLSSRLIIATPRALSINLRYMLLALFLSYSDT
jgi:hypothetical protein